MAVPKVRKSKAKTRSRKSATTRLHLPQLSSCPTCGAKKLPHRVCPKCGYYKGKEIVNLSDE